ncbi:hypothetical protein GCM10010922_24600 [Microbacterium sorbitolivorans]|uniref:hypothetical protein n=1 Tax=Microbacterium sorbitolivorans TaxID=1867410 RepID=UPI00165173A9|nr:hypothetical protein [Microbacterium sorbitolivorans]GGF47837.1 hypothetical protein GCM10010922_24600 [Microbacterium sorbitolivorans]
MDQYWVTALITIAPTVIIAAIFFWILRNVLKFDRTERRVYSKIEAEERAKRGMAPRD